MFCYFRCFSFSYCLAAFLIGWMKNTYSHYSRMDILTHYSPIYRGTMGSKKDFWQERSVLLIVCLFLVILHFYADLLINK